MPIYMFKCPKCKRDSEIIIGFHDFISMEDAYSVGRCLNAKCKTTLFKQYQQINFAGGINMNASSMGISQKKYNNKSGGPVGLSGGKAVGRAKV